CRAELGNVIHARSGRRLGYGALAAAASAVPVPSSPTLKAAKDFKLIGKSTARRDTPDKTNGRAVFGIDVQLEGLKVAMVALSPVQGGTVIEPLNTSAALAVRGVRQVVNERDVVAVVADDTWASLKGLEALGLRWHDGSRGARSRGAKVGRARPRAATDPAEQPADRRRVWPPSRGGRHRRRGADRASRGRAGQGAVAARGGYPTRSVPAVLRGSAGRRDR